MNFTSHDIAVIEQALQISIRNQESASKAHAFQEVLSKLKASAAAVMNYSAVQTIEFHDGLRFDYDDSSDTL